MDRLKNLNNIFFFAYVVMLNWYLFQLILLLKSNCSSSFALSCVVEVTIGIESFPSVIVNFSNWFAAVVATKKGFFRPS